MAAPRQAPAGARESLHYRSPDVVQGRWSAQRPGVVQGAQPTGPRLGTQGPDQGFGLTIANRLAPKLRLQTGERKDDAIRGCVGIALRRASIFGRAPVVHDVNLAFTIWGFFDEQPPAELVETRMRLFEGVANVNHHYTEGRHIADLVPEETLAMSPAAALDAYPAHWRALTGA